MECPFCAEMIKSEAIVCKSCGRDLKLVKPVILEIRDVSVELDRLQRKLNRIDVKLGFREAPFRTMLRYSIFYVVPTVVLLLIAHYLIILVFNLPPLILRLASIAIPLPFGIAALAIGKIEYRGAFVMGALIGLLGVSGMLIVIGIIDAVSIIPSTGLEWREFGEYTVSVALAFLTGNIIAYIGVTALPAVINGDNHPSKIAMRLAKLLGGHSSTEGLRRRARRIQDLIQTVGPLGSIIATAGGSIYAGLKSVMN